MYNALFVTGTDQAVKHSRTLSEGSVTRNNNLIKFNHIEIFHRVFTQNDEI